jgi:hypothetical protein
MPAQPRPDWQKKLDVVVEYLIYKVHARVIWDGFISLNPDAPKKKDVYVAHWVGPNCKTYIVRCFTDAGGWDVFVPVTSSNEVKETLAAVSHAPADPLSLMRDAHALAMLALQSERYQKDADYREATDKVLARTKDVFKMP